MKAAFAARRGSAADRAGLSGITHKNPDSPGWEYHFLAARQLRLGCRPSRSLRRNIAKLSHPVMIRCPET